MANQDKAWANIIAKAWSDPAFKEKLLSDPQSACEECGIELPAGVNVQIHENSATELHITLPAKPAGELSQQQLEAVAAGAISGAIAGAIAGHEGPGGAIA